ncbi:MAG: DUF4236 domain-containing protein [Microthrixaceae bacterium]
MGFRLRKSIQLMPGVRLNMSRSGLGVSAGVKGFRISQRPDGTVQQSVSMPGTGISHVQRLDTASGASTSRTAAAREAIPATPTTAPTAQPIAPRKKPGWFAPKPEKALYRAMAASDVLQLEHIAREQPSVSVAAACLAGLLQMQAEQAQLATNMLMLVWSSGKEPAADPFIQKYVAITFTLVLAPGVSAPLSLSRNTVGLALAELLQLLGSRSEAVDIVEQLEPTAATAISLAELYSELGRWAEVVELTDEVTNQDDLTALLCVFRGVAMRELAYYDAARIAFKEALKTKQRNPVIRHRAWLERARCYEREGKRSLARKDLERILAEDSTYVGLTEALAELN